MTALTDSTLSSRLCVTIVLVETVCFVLDFRWE